MTSINSLEHQQSLLVIAHPGGQSPCGRPDSRPFTHVPAHYRRNATVSAARHIWPGTQLQLRIARHRRELQSLYKHSIKIFLFRVLNLKFQLFTALYYAAICRRRSNYRGWLFPKLSSCSIYGKHCIFHSTLYAPPDTCLQLINLFCDLRPAALSQGRRRKFLLSPPKFWPVE